MGDWYEEVKPGESLSQGQILPNFSMLQPTYQYLPSGQPEVVKNPPQNIIILTQSCDLARPEKGPDSQIEHNILIAPMSELTKDLVKKNHKEYPKYKSVLLHWIPADESFKINYSLIRFSLVASVPYSAIAVHAQKNQCFRLRSPYLEHLAHRFGFVYSRVGLPEPLYDEVHYEDTVSKMKGS